jgi:DNA-binding transcriptional ArsR family regulator
MAQTNQHGDLVLAETDVLRLVADPTRYAILTELQRRGATSVAQLALRVEASPPDVEHDLQALAEHGLVRPVPDPDGGRARWEALGRGLLVEASPDPEGQAAARLVATRMFLEAAAMPPTWWADAEPRLPLDWQRAGGLVNAGLWLTADELRSVYERIEELTLPFATRSATAAPEGARRVRIQCYLMPEPD